MLWNCLWTHEKNQRLTSTSAIAWISNAHSNWMARYLGKFCTLIVMVILTLNSTIFFLQNYWIVIHTWRSLHRGTAEKSQVLLEREKVTSVFMVASLFVGFLNVKWCSFQSFWHLLQRAFGSKDVHEILQKKKNKRKSFWKFCFC